MPKERTALKPPFSYHTHTSKQEFVERDYIGKIGWGMNNPALTTNVTQPSRVVLKTGMPHKVHFDTGRTHEFLADRGSNAASPAQKI